MTGSLMSRRVRVVFRPLRKAFVMVPGPLRRQTAKGQESDVPGLNLKVEIPSSDRLYTVSPWTPSVPRGFPVEWEVLPLLRPLPFLLSLCYPTAYYHGPRFGKTKG